MSGAVTASSASRAGQADLFLSRIRTDLREALCKELGGGCGGGGGPAGEELLSQITAKLCEHRERASESAQEPEGCFGDENTALC